jgi:isopentenyl phosphate kinase
LVEAQLQLDALGQLLLEFLRGRDDALADFENVVAVLLIGGHEHGALAVEAANVRVLLRVPVHFGDIADTYGATVDSGDDCVTHFVQ